MRAYPPLDRCRRESSLNARMKIVRVYITSHY